LGQSVAVVIPFKYQPLKLVAQILLIFVSVRSQRANDDESIVRSIIRELQPKEYKECEKERDRALVAAVVVVFTFTHSHGWNVAHYYAELK